MSMMRMMINTPAGEHKNRPCVNVDAVTELNNIDREAGSSPNIGQNDKVGKRQKMRGRVLDSRNKGHNADGVNSSSNLEPRDAMDFESKEEAFSFYKEYAKSLGFSAIIKASRRSRISGKFIDAKFVCTKYGSKQNNSTAETGEPAPNLDFSMSIPVKRKRGRINKSWAKTDCKACMHVKRRQDGRWIIRNFIKDHNHEIFPDQAYNYFWGHNKHVYMGDAIPNSLNSIGARTKRQSGGYKKVENQQGGVINQIGSNQQLALDEGETQVMLDTFIDMQNGNPHFLYAIDLNEEQRLRNVLWVDAKGRLDYKYFNDVVLFDTTYIKNEYKLPFIPFIGVNHHNQFLLLGCALIAEESKSTYLWLMKTWLKAMSGRAPTVIFSDQDRHLKEAIAEVLPESHHRFCFWHVLSKIPEKLSYVTRQHENFMNKFNKCIFKSWTAEQFEKRWLKMIDRFDLRKDRWIQSLHDDRQRWVPAYIQNIFLGGMSTSQRSESINSFLDKYVQRKTSLKDILAQYKSIVKVKYEEEAQADFETWHKQPLLKSPSPFGKQMAMVYTHSIFKKFQVEVLGVVACHPKKVSEDGSILTYKVQDFEENREFIVVWDEKLLDASCSCHSFEHNGYLCRHVMILLQMSGMHNIPSKYILKRWTKDAKKKQMIQESDVVDSRIQRYKDLCQTSLKLSDEASLSQESFTVAFNALEEALKKCDSVNNPTQGAIESSSQSPPHDFHDFDELNQEGSGAPKSTKKSTFWKSKVYAEQDFINIGLHGSWEQLEQLNSRAQTLDSFSSQQIVQGTGGYNFVESSLDDYYGNRQSIQGLGQLNSIAPIHEGQYINQQIIQELSQLHPRPETIQSCFNQQDKLQDDMNQPNVGRPHFRDMMRKHMH